MVTAATLRAAPHHSRTQGNTNMKSFEHTDKPEHNDPAHCGTITFDENGCAYIGNTNMISLKSTPLTDGPEFKRTLYRIFTDGVYTGSYIVRTYIAKRVVSGTTSK